MGLDEFMEEKCEEDTAFPESESLRRDITINTKDDAVEALERITEYLGHPPTYNEWNNVKDEVNVSSPPRRMSEELDITLNELKREVGKKVDNEAGVTEQDVYRDFLKAAQKHGKDFTRKEFVEDEELMDSKTARINANAGFNEIKGLLGLDKNREKMSKEDVVEWLEDNKPNISRRDVISDAPFGPKAVSRYGAGSFSRGLRELGFKGSGGGSEMSGNAKKADELLEKGRYEEIKNSIDKEFGWVYVLRMEHDKIGEELFYVGSVAPNSTLIKRMTEHIRLGGAFRHPTLGNRRDYRLSVEELVRLETVEREFLEEQRDINTLKERLADREREVMLEVALENNTTEVYGGK